MFLPCQPCCGGAVSCDVADGKPRTDPKDEGTWVPSGTWTSGVTWTWVPNPGDESGETWFFYGSSSTSKPGGVATIAEQRDWGNLCNWYSNKTNSPSIYPTSPSSLNKRATIFPPANAVVHIYTTVSTATSGPQVVKNIYIWYGLSVVGGSSLTTTASAHDSVGGTVFIGNSLNTGGVEGGSVINNGAKFCGSTRNINGTVNGGAEFIAYSRNSSTVNGGATFYDLTLNYTNGVVNGGAVFNGNARNQGSSAAGLSAVVNGGAVFNGSSFNSTELGVINGGATFNDSAYNQGEVNGGGWFYGTSRNYFSGVVNDGGWFYDSSSNATSFPIVNGGATFYDTSRNGTAAIVNGGATFYGSSINGLTTGIIAPVVNDGATFNDDSKNGDSAGAGVVNGGAVFNDNATNGPASTVNGGATFNDAACSFRYTGSFSSVPCSRKFVAHSTDIPTCGGTAPNGCANAADTCGCG